MTNHVPPFLAATFSVDAVATVVEGEVLMACVRMTSAAAALHNDVLLTLSTIEDTGMQMSHFSFNNEKTP